MFGFGWKPKEGIVYRSWFRGGTHSGKSADVFITFDGKTKERGTFSITGNKCEIRLGKGEMKWGMERGDWKFDEHTIRRLIMPKTNVSFSKKTKQIYQSGQNGYVGKEICYVAKIKQSKQVTSS